MALPRPLLAVALAVGLLSCSEPAETVRVGVIQTAGVDGSVEDNAEHASTLVRDAAAKGARYIVLPELYTFFPAARAHEDKDTVQREAEEKGGLFTQRMVDLAKELDVNIAFGTPEVRDGKLHNALVFVEPDGVVGSYAKRWLIGIGPKGRTEFEVFKPGPPIGALNWGDIRVGAMICSDGGADGLWRRLLDDGAEIVIWASSGLRLKNRPKPAPAERAQIEKVPVAFANRSRPTEPFQTLYGGSVIADGGGAILAEADTEADVVLVADVPLRRVRMTPSGSGS